MQPLVISQVYFTSSVHSDVLLFSKVSSPRTQVKRPFVCTPKLYSLYWKLYSSGSFLITCKAASQNFYCPAHWAQWQHTKEIRTHRQAMTGHAALPMNMIWKQRCQASEQQDHISKKLWSCSREPWLSRASWLRHSNTMVNLYFH